MIRRTSTILSHQILSKRNWVDMHPVLLARITEADFVSFDYELTGLHEKNERYIGVPQCYDAHCEGVKKFIPVQLGVCAAKLIGNKWTLTPASIYLYPNNTPAVDDSSPCFSVSTSALNFLVQNGFDCNEWITQGLGWLKPNDEAERRKSIQARIDEITALMSKQETVQDGSSNSDLPIEIPSVADKEAMEKVRADILQWNKSTECLEIPMDSAFLRLIAHSFISREFPHLFSHSVRRGDQRLICVYKDKNRLFKEQLNSLESEMSRLDQELGARGVFDAISKAKVPVIGHNCFYDLLHTYHSFYGETPAHVDQFKQRWLAKFARTFDTKYLAESNDILGGLQPPATLKGLCDFMMQSTKDPVSFDIHNLDQSVYQLKDDLSHDAGYDAMMTSLVFLHQLKHILDRKSLSFENIDFKSASSKPGTSTIPIHDLLRSGVNRIRLVRTQPSFINLKERE